MNTGLPNLKTSERRVNLYVLTIDEGSYQDVNVVLNQLISANMNYRASHQKRYYLDSKDASGNERKLSFELTYDIDNNHWQGWVGVTRSDAIPVIDTGIAEKKVTLDPDDVGLLEKSHYIIEQFNLKNGRHVFIVVFENNRYAVGITAFSRICKSALSCCLNVEQLYRKDIINTLLRIKWVKKFKIKMHRLPTQVLSDNKHTLSEFFRALQKYSEQDGYVTLEVGTGRKKEQYLSDSNLTSFRGLLRLVKENVLDYFGIESLSVDCKMTESGPRQSVNVLKDALGCKKRFPLSDEKSRVIDEKYVYGILREVYTDFRDSSELSDAISIQIDES